MRDDDQHTQDQYDDHMTRVDAVIRQFRNGEISADQKRRYIAEENMAYYRDENMRSNSTNERLCKMPRIRNEVAAVISDATGAPADAVRVALNRRAELCLAADRAPTRAEAAELLAESRTAFTTIIKNAIPRRGHQS